MLIFALTSILVACNQEEESSKPPVKDSEPVETEEVIVDESEYANVFPLTGIETNEEVNQRPFAVMINNHPAARPQSGLTKADIIYEVLAEGDITRFLAVFQSEAPEIIGPVRSARDYFIELSKGFDAFYVAHGFSETAKEILSNGSIDNINGMYYDGSLFWRSEDRVAPHNSYTSYTFIKKGASDNGYNFSSETASLPFLTEKELNGELEGEAAPNVKVSYSSRSEFAAEYRYNNDVNRYERYSNGEQTIDYETREPVLLDNVLIVEMEHKILDNGRRSININSGGSGLLLQKGKAREVEWRNVEGRIIPFIGDKEAGFVPGRTWINIIPKTPGIAGAVSYGN